MKNLKKYLCAGLCVALAASMAACSGEKELPSSSQPESSAVSTVSSEPEPESSHFVPAPDLIPSTPAPSVSTGSGVEVSGFEEEFSQNPIDKKYDDDYARATSFSMMRQACDSAAANWKVMVDVAYDAAYEATPEDGRAELQEEQEAWKMELDSTIRQIKEEAGDDNEGALSAGKEIVLLYRERAMELCRIKYDADGTLPEFPTVEETGSAVG